MQPFRRIELILLIFKSVLLDSHLRVKCLAQGINIDIERGKTWYFSENPSPSGIRNRTAGSDIGKPPRSITIVPRPSSIQLDKCLYSRLKHTTTLFSLSHHDILSREWKVIAHQVQTNYHGRPSYIVYNQSGATELLIMVDFHYLIMVVCALSQLKPSVFYTFLALKTFLGPQ